jgi:hypothetical protein
MIRVTNEHRLLNKNTGWIDPHKKWPENNRTGTANV